MLPLIPNPKNAKQRKEAKKREAVARAQYLEVQRLGGVIAQLDMARAETLSAQLTLARDLAAAGAPMEGVIWRESTDG